MNVKYTTCVNENTIGILASHMSLPIFILIALTLCLIFLCALTYDDASTNKIHNFSDLCH